MLHDKVCRALSSVWYPLGVQQMLAVVILASVLEDTNKAVLRVTC